LNKTA